MVYEGEAADKSEMTPEEGTAVMAMWGAWMEKMGPAPAALTIGHPYLSEGKGDFAIDIFELMPVPMDN